MDPIKDSSLQINKMYKKLSYLDQYGESVLLMVILYIALFLIYSYFSVMKNIQPIKANWPAERCKPQNIMFAGFINKPTDKSVFEFTGENFNYCLNNIQTSITGYLMEPVSYLIGALNAIFEELTQILQYLRMIINRIRNSLVDIASDVMGRLSNFIIPLQQIVIGIRDTMEKIKGILTASIYTSLGTFYVLKSAMGAVTEVTISLLIALAALIVVTWIIAIFYPPFITAAITMTTLFVSVSIPLAVILVFMAEVMHVNLNSSVPTVPSRPAPSPGSCFHPDTLIKKKDGTVSHMKDICLGDILENGSKVKAVMKIDNLNQGHTLYKIAGGVNGSDIYVTGSHMIQDSNDGRFIKVKDSPVAILQESVKTEWFSCFITDDHKIQIGKHTFWDWEDYLL
jgi:hypothetical protein